MTSILVIKKIKIQNANALSSPYTIGFPAMTAWLGAVHALQRFLNQNEKFKDLKFKGVNVACHDIDLQVLEGKTNKLILPKMPMTKKKHDGPVEPASFIPEARCHLEVSLVIEYDGMQFYNNISQDELKNAINRLLHSRIKFAGGDVISRFDHAIEFINSMYKDEDVTKLTNHLMPGYLLVDRQDLVQSTMEEENIDALDAVISHLQVTVTRGENGTKPTYGRKSQGWIAPIATGFMGITELGKALNQRDSDTQHRFAEPIITLGEFKMPCRFKTIRDIQNMLWYYHFDEANDLYLCKHNKQKEFN